MKHHHAKQFYRAIACAIFAGALAAPFAAQTAYALPIEGANAATNAGEANISTSGTVMDIAGKTEHNILKWEDFSIEQNEKVRFDGGSQTRDYLNLVTGEGASNIYGTIEGGRNVYLVNPHGILFAKGSEVNTGALYLSTANVDAVASAAGTSWGGNSPLSASTQYGNVLNLGTVQTAKLYIEGRNVTVHNTADVQNADGTPLTGNVVTIRSTETAHIGYDVGNKITRNFTVNGATVAREVSDYASTNVAHHAASAKSHGWDVANLGGTAHTDYDYMRVHTVYDLQNINAKRDGRYILAGDINATATKDWNSGEGFLPLGPSHFTQFSGRFDGVGHTITGLYIRRNESYTGLFGCTIEAHIENLSLVDGYVEGEASVGGIVGGADKTLVRNVSYAGRVVGDHSVGGIVGRMSGGSIQNVWNAGEVRGTGQFLVGGIVGVAGNNAVIQNVCNTGAITGTQYVGGIVGIAKGNIQNAWNTGAVTGTEQVGGIMGALQERTLQNAWNTGTVTGSQKVGGIVGEVDGGTLRHAVSKAGSAGQAVGALSNGADVTTDVKVAHEADMKLAATYMDWKDEHGNAVVATEGGKGTPWRIYDGKTTPLLTGLMKGTKRLEKVYDGKTFGDGDAHILSDTPLEKNVGTRDARGIYSDAFGYDLIGSTYRIAPRVLTMSGVAAQSKTYDGTTAADIAKFSATLGNIVAGEESLVSATATGAAYNSKDVRAANAVSYTLALSGAGAGNYRIARTVQGAGSITAKQLNLALMSGARFDKTYDGTANVTQTLTKGTNYSLTGFIGTEGDHLALAAAMGTYTAGKGAAVNKGVTFDGLSLTGTGAGNYTLDKTTLTGTGTITPRALTLALTGGVRFDKTYDGNASVTQSLTKDRNYTLTNFVNGEGADIALAPVTGTYTDKNAGTGKTVTFGGLTLTGAGAGNYVLNTSTLAGTGTIAHRDLTLTADAKSIVQDGPLPAFTGQASGFAEGEDASVFGADGITFGTTVTNTDRPSRYDIIGRVGGVSDGVVGNYRIRQTADNATAFTIHAAALPGGLLAALVQDAAPRFDFGFGDTVYLYGTARPIRAATLGLYRFDAERAFEIQGLRL